MTTEKQKTGGNATRKDYAALEREVVELRALNARLIKASEARYLQLKELNARLRRLLS